MYERCMTTRRGNLSCHGLGSMLYVEYQDQFATEPDVPTIVVVKHWRAPILVMVHVYMSGRSECVLYRAIGQL